MDQYFLKQKKQENDFYELFRAQSLNNHQYYAVKLLKKKYNQVEKVKKNKEIQAYKYLMPHQHIVNLEKVLYDEPTGKVAIVFQLMDQNLYDLLASNTNLNKKKIKLYMYQLLKVIEYIHSKGIFHRGIKPQNVFLKGDKIKLGDFSFCKGIYSQAPYTEYISTRWYRAPQCLLTDGYYNNKIDIWAYGCILFQMIAKTPLFNGKDEMDQIKKIIKVLGSPKPQLIQFYKSHSAHLSEQGFNFPQTNGIGFLKLLPQASPDLIDLLCKLLAFDPQERVTATQALQHQFFTDIVQEMATMS